MASLRVRKLDDIVYEQLRIRAARHGVPIEEEVCKILSQAVCTPDRMSEVFRKHFGAENGIDLELVNPRKPYEPMTFDLLKAPERNESVKILHHGRLKGLITSCQRIVSKKVKQHPFFGMNTSEETSVLDQMAKLRGGRYEDDL